MAILSDLSIARGFLSRWCVDRGIREQAPDDENIRILDALLSQSQELLSGNTLPKIPKHTIAIPARVDLTERRWSRFVKWFEQDYKQPMIRHCRAKNAGALIPQREANGRGGRGDRYEARYFFSYEDSRADIEIQQISKPSESGDKSGKATPREIDNQKQSLASWQQPIFIYTIVLIALAALIAFMSLLSLIAARGGTQVFVLSADHSLDQEKNLRER